MILSKALRAAAGNVAPAPSSSDPQFNYVSMLLHGDGTNGAQNNTFVDSSSNNFTITRNGNTTQGSLSPYGNLWSNFFGSTTGSLTVAGGMPSGTGTAFTMECWIYITSLSDYNAITRGDLSPRLDWGVNTSGALILDSVTVGNICASASNTIQANVWYHVVVTRSTSNIYKLWVNGTNVATSSAFGTSMLANTTIGYSSYSSGHYFKGYISNFRVVTSEVYTSAFTPPTAPLTAISGTSLLTCQSNRFIDNSANNFTITRNGDVRVTKEAPFLPTAAYSTSVIGGSGYFDGTGDYLNTPSNAAFSFGTGDFTVELWAYCTQDLTNGTTQFSLYSSESLNSSGSFGLFFLGGTWYVRINGLGNDLTTAASASQRNAWVHFAVCRNAGTMTFYINGAAVASGNRSTQNVTQTQAYLGFLNGFTGYDFAGYISNVRVVKGTAVYTSNFTPPTAPLTAITNTSLLLNFTNAGIFDNAAENNLETVGNAQISTSVKKYGTGSLAFDGTGDWLLAPNNPNIQLGAGAFTIECWVYRTTSGSSMAIAGKAESTTTGWEIWINSSGLFSFFVGSLPTSSALVPLSTWTHVAVVRAPVSNGITLYVNGVSSATTTSTTNFTDSGLLYVGAGRTGRLPFTGYIDDFRITKGYARYTANFTPPTAAFPDQ